MPASRSPALRPHLQPRHKLWLNWNGAFLMGPRYLRFLEAVEDTGTIRAAARLSAEARRLVTLFARWRRDALRLSDVAFRKIMRR